jgi:UDP-N-acetylmuramoylalanine-D-glutamate ligase
VVALAGLPTVAAAKDLVICVRQPSELAVAACSRAIDSHQYTGRILVQLYAARGASFDQYPNFEVRGDSFSNLVRAIPGLAERK